MNMIKFWTVHLFSFLFDDHVGPAGWSPQVKNMPVGPALFLFSVMKAMVLRPLTINLVEQSHEYPYRGEVMGDIVKRRREQYQENKKGTR
jgi:hypothetical protein